jgi:hypothetical protein
MEAKKIKINFVSHIWILTALFVFLKISGIIDWSLWLVFSPVLIFYGIVILPFVVIIVVAILSFIVGVIDEVLKRIIK